MCLKGILLYTHAGKRFKKMNLKFISATKLANIQAQSIQRSVSFRLFPSLYIIMLTHSEIYLCSSFKEEVKPSFPQQKLNTVPKNLQRTSPLTFTLCDHQANRTKIIEKNINGEQNQIEEFEGLYTTWDFSNDNVLLLNREGDLLFYNMLSKSTFILEKQHPGLYIDAQIMHTDEHFITCGGCVKNPTTSTPQRIIKVWKIEEFDSLTQVIRMNSGHKRPIEYSFLMNKGHIVTLSSDKTVRFHNIVVGQVASIVETGFQPLSGCQLDYNSVVVGGNYNSLKIFDLRMKKSVLSPIKLNWNLIQVVNMTRFTDNALIVSNINQLHLMDLRNWKTRMLGEYEGERISSILALNEKDFVVGNKEKTYQIWECV